jgi:hypothetical protein
LVRRAGPGARKRRSARSLAKRKRPAFKLPKAFRIVPIRSKAKPKRHAHVFGAEGLPPCPAGCTYVMRTKIGGFYYCVYTDEEGMDVLFLC